MGCAGKAGARNVDQIAPAFLRRASWSGFCFMVVLPSGLRARVQTTVIVAATRERDQRRVPWSLSWRRGRSGWPGAPPCYNDSST